MPAPSRLRGTLRRLDDPDRPGLAVLLMVASSLGLLAWVWVSLPAGGPASSEPVVAAAPLSTTSMLLDGPTRIVLPLPSDDGHRARAIVNHRAAGVEVGAQLVNGEGLDVELSEAGTRATEVLVTSSAVHRCGQYAGSVVLEASHATLPADVLVVDVRFGECPEEPEPIALAPDTVNDLEPTWADEGVAPWVRRAPAPPPPPAPEPTDTATDTESPTTDPDDPEGDDQPDTPVPTSSPEQPSNPSPTASPSPTAEPSPTPTSDPSPSGDPSPSTDPGSSSPSETGGGDGGGGTTDGGGSEEVATSEPTPTP